MTMHHVIGTEDRAAFLDCRRVWDLSARERRNLEPARPAHPVDVQRALRDALAVYYFPGMWDWSPAVVLPLVRKAFTDSVAAQRAEYLDGFDLAKLPSDRARATDEQVARGLRLLEEYAAWAPTVDEFAPIQVVAEVDVQVPDPDAADRELAVGNRAVRYRDRIDIIAMDAESRYWLVEHRFVADGWPDVEAVLRDDRALTWCWAWEYDHPGQHIQGTIHNELRLGTDSPDDASSPVPPSGPRSTVAQNQTVSSPLGPATDEYDLRIQFGDRFRRCEAPRQPAEIAAGGRRLSAQLAEMIDEATRVYANPGVGRCNRCAFRAPCLALDAHDSTDAPTALLAESYRPRTHDARGGTLGARTWSMGRGAAPPRP